MLPSAPRNGEVTNERTPSPSASNAPIDLAQDRSVHHGIAHDAALAHVVAAGLELRLHEQHELRLGGGEREQVGRDRAQRDEREIRDAEIGGRIDRARLELAHVRALHHRDPHVVTERPRELSTADVDREHVLRRPGEGGSR